MDISIKKSDLATRAVGALAVGVLEHEKKLSGPAAALDRATRGALSALFQSGDFTGKHLETAVLHPPGVKAKRVLLVGMGARAALTGQRVLLVAAQAARRAREMSAGTLAVALEAPGLGAEAVTQALAEGAVLGHYRHTAYRTGSRSALERIELCSATAVTRAQSAAVAHGAMRGEAVCLARDLANTPGQDLVPEQLAQHAREIGKRVGAKVSVFDVAAMERLGMGCILAVGRGSANPPRFIVLDRPATARRGKKPQTIVIIGKGVTFDTGGYSLKPREGMSKMKYDMGGSAAVLGFFASLPALGDLPVRIVGLIPSAENMVGARAVKPGDVVRALDGTTVEITNTDAEGRLLLADALGYAKRFEPDAVLDLATLTGAISIALGRQYAGLFTTDDRLAAELQTAGETVHERLWRMPMNEDYLAEMKSDTADLVNSNERREGASSTAASFLMHFAKDMRWAHLDIASTGWTYAERADSPRGANGFGARLLTRWLETRLKG
ncbi:MAG: leucyl aminopeptidase [Candidatus Eisenbacteria bacterium]